MKRVKPTNQAMQPLFQKILSDDHTFEVVRSRFDRQILRVPANHPGETDLFVKVYRHLGLISRFKAGMAKTGGYHDWRICGRLYRAGLCVPQPVGRAKKPAWGMLPHKTLFAQQWISDGHPLSQLVHQKKKAGQLTEQWLGRLHDAIGEFVATIHQQGLYPRDLHPGNVLLREPEKEEFTLILVDYESIQKRRPYQKSKAHLNLGHICSYLDAFSPDTHERLAAAYRRVRPDRAPPDLAAKVLQVAQKHLANRQKRMDRAFEQIAMARRKT